MTFRILALAFLYALPAATQDPETFSQLSERASAARAGGDAKTAIGYYKRALQLKPDWAEGWWAAGSLAYDNEAYKEATDAFRQLAGLRPRAGLALGMLGLSEYEIAEYTLAFDHIGRALAIGVGDQPQLTLVLKFHEAALLTNMGQFEAALQKYTDFIPAKLTDEQVLVGLGLAHLRVASTPAGIGPAHRDLYLAIGGALAAYLTRDEAVAKSRYASLIARFANEPDAHYAYGYFLFGLDPEGAIAEWEQALRMAPSHAAAHAMLSWGLWLREDGRAAAHAQAALDKDPGIVVARIVLGRSLVARGELAGGIENLVRAASADPSNLEAHLALATAYSEAGRKLDARRERLLCLSMQGKAGAVALP